MDELSPSPDSTLFNRVVFPIVLIVLGILSLWTIDFHIGRFFSLHELPDELADFFDAAEHFGTPYGQLLALIAIYFATPNRDRRVYRIFAGTCVAGLSANLVKLCVSRTRPRAFDFDQQELLNSFVGYFLFGDGGSKSQSFPSAHTASAFGFAAMLTWAYPRGRNAFLILAFCVGLHRITTSAHYPSDVFIGATVGWSVAWFFTGKTWFGTKFDQLEAKAE